MLLPTISKARNPVLRPRKKRGYGPITTPVGTTCGLCHRQVSQYTCPKCNVPYCSLDCFRSENHAQCSEPFYKREIENEIRTQPAASAEDRANMIEMLKRLENEDGGVMSMHELDERGDEEEDEDELMARLGDIDLDSTSADTLWALLPPSKRAAFMKSVQDPDSALARVLLGEVERERGGGAEVPWWVEDDCDDVAELGEDVGENVGEDDNEKIDESRMGRRRLMPAMMELPPTLMVSTSDNASQQTERQQGPPLLYNVLAFVLVYAYAVRHFGVAMLSSLIPPTISTSTSPKPRSEPSIDPDLDPLEIALADARAAAQSIHTLAPFLGEKNSKTVFGSVDAVVKDLWSRLQSEGGKNSGMDGNNVARTISLLLQDALTLLTPKRVSIINADEPTNATSSSLLHNHAYNLVLLSFSDAISLFDTLANLNTLSTSSASSSAPTTSTSTNKKPNTKPADARSARAAHKLRFYAAWMVRTVRGADEWSVKGVVREVEEKVRVLEREVEEGEMSAEGAVGEVKTRE